ncbi:MULTISPECIES: membrane dipeptidase [Actinomadura]|uniref:Membrane dipeptidase n=1 Tax=Actinomadura yumaensis TaxID=111807 RepID=A0ABW2CME7_9ACTN|nr:membrane dipeptidase [Actinomadura sp. J1-007]MWK34300.1 Coagulation factor 5/8 type domain-containing protein [Actinomadura sp. J1-007]
MPRRVPVPLLFLLISLGLLGVGAAPLAATAAPPASSAPSAAGADVVRGYVDAHTHLMSYEGFGGEIICGAPFHQEGIEKALRDCPHHEPDGALALFENITTKGSPFGTHDPKGWPTFKYWPNNRTATHQQVYYKWLERSWRAGQRILVNQLVTNRVLCEIYVPARKYPCDEMDSIRLQAKRTYELQDYIDKEYGGPGKGWFRVVRDPAAARKVVQEGKLAVVLGIETSEPLGCRGSELFPGCTRAQIDKGLDEMRELGVSSMFLCHKFDNALCGVRFDSGMLGVALNGGNILSSGHNWQAETCKGPVHDNTIPSVFLKPPHCNLNGLTELGEYTVKAMMKRGMLIELDHMSAKAAGQTLTLLEQAGYPGVVSGHSWADESYTRRIYRLGGMVTAMGDSADGFTAQWRNDKAARDPNRLYGYGYGLDANGVATLPNPRPNGDLKYPFTSPFDPSVTMERLTTGERTWDLNKEGVANYGLVADWMADIAHRSGAEIIGDLSLGAEVYLRMWEQARPRT